MSPGEIADELGRLKGRQAKLRSELDDLQCSIDQLALVTECGTPKPAGKNLSTEPEAARPSAQPPPLPENVVAKLPAPGPFLPDGPFPVESGGKPAGESAELRFGRYWLVRLGVVLVVTGLVFLANHAWQEFGGLLGAAGRVMLIFLAGGFLLGLGHVLERWKHSLAGYGRVLSAGGLAVQYYSVFAAHYVPSLRLVHDPVSAGILLLIASSGMVAYAVWRRSQVVGIFGILLAFFASGMNSVTEFTLFSNVLLCAAAVFLMIRCGWSVLGGLSLAAAYSSYAWWRVVGGLDFGAPDDSWVLRLGVLSAYWTAFTLAAWWPHSGTPSGRSAFATGNNAAFFAFASFAVLSGGDQEYGTFALGGAVLFFLVALLGRMSCREDRGRLFALFCAHAILASFVGICARFEGDALALVLAAQAAALAWCGAGRTAAARVASFGAVLAGILACVVAVGGWFGDSAVLTRTAVAVLLLTAAWLHDGLQRIAAAYSPVPTRSAVFAVLALPVWLLLVAETVAPEWRGVSLGLLGLLSAGAFSLHCSRGIAVGGLSLTAAALVHEWSGVAVRGYGLPVADLLLILLAVATPVVLGRVWPAFQSARFGRIAGGVVRMTAGALFVPWVADYVPAAHRLWVLVVVAIPLVLASDSGFRFVRLGLAVFFAVLGLAAFASEWIAGSQLGLAMAAGGVLLVLMQQLTKVSFAQGRFPPLAGWLLVFAGLGVVWAVLSSRVIELGGWSLTASWGVFGGVVLAFGMGIRERAVRWFAFLVFAIALLRLATVEVWQLDTWMRIAGFLGMGFALLATGFLYNRYQSRLRQWL